jgi:tetratricopeptide (TPR) repeat protein
LREAIGWSYELLEPEQRRLLRAVAVFRGGWTAAAAAAVVATDAGAVTAGLEQLLSKSLLEVRGEGEARRYGVLESIRQYGRERLEEEGETADAERRHRAWFLGLAEEAAGALAGTGMGVWLERLDEELDNFRAAIETALVAEPEAAARFGVALQRYWDIRGLFREGADWLERTLATWPGEGELRARALAALGRLLLYHGRIRDAGGVLELALAASREVGDPKLVLATMTDLGQAAMQSWDVERTRALSADGLALARRQDDANLTAEMLLVASLAPFHAGECDTGMGLVREALALARQAGNKRLEARLLVELGLNELGPIQASEATRAAAQRHLEAGRELADQIGDHFDRHFSRWALALQAITEGRLDDARGLLIEALDLVRMSRDMFGLPFALEALGYVDALTGVPNRAARLLGAAEVVREITGSPAPTASQSMSEAALGAMRAASDEGSIRAAWAAGRAMTSSEALAYSLGEWDPEAPPER